ncbi:dTDP-glucose 4,6-dehydratase [Nocardiopsis kunsanensis]|uniref:dTDP-glucose 4,6-dehydratase n=1 Tax=Nocardiopsis kunsanensis TaxID=141693 RepID=A0A918X855_9ACTN|nr:dTDP-glucose 4,6-dehydratase [Nocardiopsis kunsanensis]
MQGAEGAHVTGLDALTYAGDLRRLPAKHPRLSFVRGDIADPEHMAEVVPEHDAVVNFAAESHVDRSIAASDAFVRTNVLGTQVLLEAARRAAVDRFLQVSTDEVYGSIGSGAWDETTPLAPNSPYSASKAGAELLVRAFHRTHGMDVSITRCCNNYGPAQHPEKLIPRFTTTLMRGGKVPLYGDGLHTREWLHVDDHCRAIGLVLMNGSAGRDYNIGGEESTNLDITMRLLGLLGLPESAIEYVADRQGHDRRYSVDDGRIREEFGYAPEVSLEDGLIDTVDWYSENLPFWE